jgi:5-methylcytosine-specific restriction protein A
MNLPFKPCAKQGCPNKSHETYCESCKDTKMKMYDSIRGGATERLYDYKWQVARKAFLKENQYCECTDCTNNNRHIIADVIHHEPDHKGDYDSFWDRSTWVPMAKKHHDRVTMGRLNKGR